MKKKLELTDQTINVIMQALLELPAKISMPSILELQNALSREKPQEK